ncbi:unnamed protein product [Zymoseptoria tritici ST99CH_3D1]|nr:unnamed protein product [Zymoseptoria tritici ST99CH_3D1]
MAILLPSFILLACGLTATSNALQSSSTDRLSTYVDPLIGTVGPIPGSAIASGNSFPGAARPWSMAKVGIDTSALRVPNGTAGFVNAGFSPLGNVTGISMTHVSGTGGTPTYGLISQMPILGDLSDVNLGDNTTYWQNRSLTREDSTVGRFDTVLLNGLEISLTSSYHSGLLRYKAGSPTNPNATVSGYADEVSQDMHVLVDLTHALPPYDGGDAYAQKFLHGDLHVRSDSSGQPSYFGSATYRGGWVQANPHTLYFCGNFTVPDGSDLVPTSAYVEQLARDGVVGAGTFSWPYDAAVPPAFTDRPVPQSFNDVYATQGSGMGLAGLFSWTSGGNNATAEKVLESRVGISYISAEQACHRVADELASVPFDEIVSQARDEWENEILGKIEVVDDGSETSKNTTLKRMLYTALYQTGLMPSDKTGENPHWETNSSYPYFDDHYTLWDTYRTLQPLYHLLYTPTYSRVLRGLIAIFTHEGYYPAGRSANWNGRVQGGTHADMVIGDAYVKNLGELSSSIDWQEAYRGMLKDADILPERNADTAAWDGATKEGRGALDDYLVLKYITRNHSRSLSRGVEYSQNDFAIYSVARKLSGVSASDIARFHDRASWWQNQWSSAANTSLFVPSISNSTSNTTFTGFVAARNSGGEFNYTDYDPLSCGSCSWGSDIYEAKVWETSFSAAPHDMARIIELMGGDEEFVRRLDVSFLPGLGTSVGINNDAGSALFNPGNEPSFAIPFLYNYVPGHHWKTANQTRATVDAFYSDARNGYPGNIDAGALPSWLVFNLIGLYPVSAQPLYLLGAPRFSSLKIHLFSGTSKETTLAIRANGLSDKSYYPQSVTFNGEKWERSWLSHEELGRGGELVFEMGEVPARWDTGERPFSMSGYK